MILGPQNALFWRAHVSSGNEASSFPRFGCANLVAYCLVVSAQDWQLFVCCQPRWVDRSLMDWVLHEVTFLCGNCTGMVFLGRTCEPDCRQRERESNKEKEREREISTQRVREERTIHKERKKERKKERNKEIIKKKDRKAERQKTERTIKYRKKTEIKKDKKRKEQRKRGRERERKRAENRSIKHLRVPFPLCRDSEALVSTCCQRATGLGPMGVSTSDSPSGAGVGLQAGHFV